MATANGIHYPEKNNTYNLAFDFWQHAISDAQQALDAANAALIGAKAYTDGEIAKATLGEGVLDATDPTVAALLGATGTASRTQVEGVSDARINTLAVTKSQHDSAAAGLVNDDDSLFRTALTRTGARPVGRGELMLNVVDFGAFGDGVTDDTAAVRAALLAARDRGGATVYFPPGEYLMSNYAQVYSNTVILGREARLIKPPIAQRASVAFFAIRTGATKGYGAGGQNITIEGITTVGRAWNGEAATLLAAHHGRNITVKDCKGIFSVALGHWIDLVGCESVLVDNCRIEGAEASTTPGEAIQIDISRADAVSVAEDTQAGFDMLPSRDITVRSCSFAGARNGSTNYPAPVAFGSHSAPLAGQWYDSIRFLDNYCGPSVARTAGVRGVVRLQAATGVVIAGNHINLGRVDVPGISIQGGTNTTGGQVDSGTVTIADNILERNRDVPAIYVSGATTVKVANNVVDSKGAATNGYSIDVIATTLCTITGNLVNTTGHASSPGGIRASGSTLAGIMSGNVLYSPIGGVFGQNDVLSDGNQVVAP